MNMVKIALLLSIGAEVVQEMLAELDLPTLRTQLQEELFQTNSEAKKKKIIKRLKLVEDFVEVRQSS